MPDLDSLFSRADDWLEVLPAYQRRSLETLLGSGKTPEEVAQIWLTTPGPSNTFPYGGERFASVFYEKLLAELEKFICDDKEYVADKRELINKVLWIHLTTSTFRWRAADPTTLRARLHEPQIGVDEHKQRSQHRLPSYSASLS